MKLRVPSPLEVAKRIYDASQEHLRLSNTFGHETRAVEAGKTRTALGRILTRTTVKKNDSALAVLMKSPSLSLMVADILKRGADAMEKLTNYLTQANTQPNGIGAGSTVNSSPDGNGFSETISRLTDIMLTKLGLIAEPDIQSDGYFLRDHFRTETLEVAREAADFIKTQTNFADTFAQQVANDTFQGPHLPEMQERVEALQNGDLDITSFATANLKTNGGIYRLGDHDYAITSDLAKRLNDQFGTSAEKVKVDAVVAFRRATPTAPEPIQIDYSQPAPAFKPAGFGP